MENLGIIVALGLALLALAVSYGGLRQTVTNNSSMLLVLQAEANKRIEVLQKIDKNLALVTLRLEALEKS